MFSCIAPIFDRMKRYTLPLILSALLFQQCSNSPKEIVANIPANTKTVSSTETSNSVAAKAVTKMDDAATILSRTQVPVLCYHHIREWKPGISASMKTLVVPPANFKAQMKSLADSGYHTITPDQYYAYLSRGESLPSKPVMLTFDDTDEEQYSIAAPELEKYGFKGVYFIMTISINRPNYMTEAQIKELSDKGHTIAAHTWDHQNVKKLSTEEDYEKEFLKPKQRLETITGKQIDYFAYPFGVMDPRIFPVLQKAGYKAAYQLVEHKRDSTYPLYTIRRILVPGGWSGEHMQKWMKVDFKG